MKLLQELLSRLNVKSVIGDTRISISDIYFNSNHVTNSSLFIAIKGESHDGHDFILDAVSFGASAIICEKFPDKIIKNVAYVKVENSAFSLALVASAFYNHPSRSIKLIGITGTNGKTSTVYYLSELFSKLKYRVGVISTIENKIINKKYPATHTTPDPIALNKLLAEMVNQNCEFCFMEVSSHGISQNRIQGLDFDIGVFTNISRDHLDYHNSFSDYVNVKKQFFDLLSKDAISIINIDDANGSNMTLDTVSRKVLYSFKKQAHYNASLIESNINGLSIIIDDVEISTKLTGAFNAYNLLVTYVVAKELKQDKIKILKLLSDLSFVPGRFNILKSQSNITGIIDYAHTPDALKQVLQSISSLCSLKKELIIVLGCGGNRDKGKRSIMGRIAAENSQLSIFTSDNPRWENPDSIIDDMCSGLSKSMCNNIKRITNREEAISVAVNQASSGYIVLVCGKGHEKFQELNGVKSPFDDFLILQKFLKT